MGWLKKKEEKKSADSRNLLGHAGLVMQSSIKVDFDFEGYSNRHIFNRLSKNSEYGFYYSPYGYLFRYPKWGVINEMGFRCKENIHEIRELYPQSIIIALFGGSTGFSILVPDHETFGQQLETMLNQDKELTAKAGKSFKVVNLSHPGNMVLNQIFNFVLFCERLKPDIVISHNGANDLVSAQINDRTLVSKYDIGYCDVLEAWGRKIHDTADVEIDYDFAAPNASDFRPAPPKNKPEDVVRAFHTRVMQFRTLALGSGATFISGFQPWITSKKQLSESEQAKLRSYNPFYQRAYSNVPQLYEMYNELLEQQRYDFVVNIHRSFQRLSEQVSHFGDVCHTLEPGDRVIAENYAAKVRSLFL